MAHYHHETICRVHYRSRYDVDLWHQGQIYRVFNIALSSDHSFIVIRQSNTILSTWVYHYGAMCLYSWPLYNLDFWSNYIFIMRLCLAKILFALWNRRIKFGTRVVHHETTCCVHLWPLYDLDLYVSDGGILSKF